MGKIKTVHIQVRNDAKVISQMWENFNKEYPSFYDDIYGYLADIVRTTREAMK